MTEPQTQPQPLPMTVDMEKNVFSQSGEDGIIERILQEYGVPIGVCVEIGANDGVYLSNTALLRQKDWRSVLVESDPSFYECLAYLPNSTPVIAEVTPDNVVELLGTHVETGVDVFSCDTDGDDLGIVARFVSEGCRPKILVVEYNPTFPPFLHRVNPLGTQKGSSLAAVIDTLSPLNYQCVYATISNVILVDSYRNNDKIRPMNAFEAFRWDAVRFVVSDFDGQNHLATMSEIVETVVNPWDQLPSARAMSYPTRLLGFNKNRKERANYNHWGM